MVLSLAVAAFLVLSQSVSRVLPPAAPAAVHNPEQQFLWSEKYSPRCGEYLYWRIFYVLFSASFFCALTTNR